MHVLDSILTDNLRDTMCRSILRAAPDEELKSRAKALLEDEAQLWRWMARAVAEISPSVFRRGDFAAIAVCFDRFVPEFYYELLKPPARLERDEDNSAFYSL
ncbi:MAG: hypothetical protein ACPH5P_00050 [Akkermansiaceae bacterium]